MALIIVIMLLQMKRKQIYTSLMLLCCLLTILPLMFYWFNYSLLFYQTVFVSEGEALNKGQDCTRTRYFRNINTA